MNFKKLILGAVAGLALASAALAQGINTVPQPGLITSILRNPTYNASSIGLVPAASATDIMCIAASATKNISIRRIIVGGTAGTAITTPIVVYRRASLDTGGTAATGLALPVGAAQISSDPASSAVLTAYTANPTINDSSPALIDSILVDIPVTTAAGGHIEETHIYGTGIDMFNRGLDLVKGSTQQICLNLNAVSISSGVLNISMEWQEN